MALSATLLIVLQSGDRFSAIPEAGLHPHRPYSSWSRFTVSPHGFTTRLPGKPAFDAYTAGQHKYKRYRMANPAFSFSALSSELPTEVPASEHRRAFDIIAPYLNREYPEGIRILKPFPFKIGNWSGYRSDIETTVDGVKHEGDFVMLISGKRIALFQVNYNALAPADQHFKDRVLADLKPPR